MILFFLGFVILFALTLFNAMPQNMNRIDWFFTNQQTYDTTREACNETQKCAKRLDKTNFLGALLFSGSNTLKVAENSKKC